MRFGTKQSNANSIIMSEHTHSQLEAKWAFVVGLTCACASWNSFVTFGACMILSFSFFLFLSLDFLLLLRKLDFFLLSRSAQSCVSLIYLSANFVWALSGVHTLERIPSLLLSLLQGRTKESSRQIDQKCSKCSQVESCGCASSRCT